MMGLPQMNMRRTLLIARRDYLGYVKTWGFWISFFLPVFMAGLIFALSSSDISVAPKRYITILNEAGEDHTQRLTDLLEEQMGERREAILESKGAFLPNKDKTKEFEHILNNDGYDAALAYMESHAPTLIKDMEEPDRPFEFVPLPADTFDGLKPYLKGEKLLSYEGKDVPLSGVMVVQSGEFYHRPEAEFWTTNVNLGPPRRLLQRYMNRLAVENYYGDTGITRKEYNKAFDNAVQVETFDPTKNVDELNVSSGSQEVTMTDRVPYLAAAGLAVILWLTIFSGSYMLLTSMIEEKLNKLLEMMLASTRFSEIIFGKLLGVAALTLTAMSPYIILGIGGVIAYIFTGQDQDVVMGLINSFDARMIIFLLIYLVLGYILYGAFFIALGAMSSSMQDAQTLTTPIMLVMTLCLMVVPLGVSSPDSPILQVATYIPFSAPFAAIIRLPSDPPLWELLLSAGFLALLCVLVVTASGRIFRYGVLSGASSDAVVSWFKRAVLRRKATEVKPQQ